MAQFAAIKKKGVFVIHRHSQLRVNNAGRLRNFKFPPQLAPLPVECSRIPNPGTETIGDITIELGWSGPLWRRRRQIVLRAAWAN
jgi:hypothetical protein